MLRFFHTRIKFTLEIFRVIDFCLSKFLTFSSKKHDPLTKPAFFQARTTMVDKMEANKASTSSDGSALEAMNSDGKEDIVAAAANPILSLPRVLGVW